MQNENLTTKLGKKAFILSVLLSYLVNFTACFFVKFKKQISITQEVNLKIKEFNYVKAGLRAIHSENVPTCSFRGAAQFIARQNIRRTSEIYLASTALS